MPKLPSNIKERTCSLLNAFSPFSKREGTTLNCLQIEEILIVNGIFIVKTYVRVNTIIDKERLWTGNSVHLFGSLISPELSDI